MGKYNKLASDIIQNIGGKENVSGLRHCVTRLRFILNDESKANDDVLKNMDGVITIMKAMGEYMVVIGEHVPEVYKEVCEQLGTDAYQSKETTTENKNKKSFVAKAMDIVMASMGPTLNLMCACGIIKGLLVILMMVGVEYGSGLYLMINAAGDCFFYFMPLLIGYNVAKKMEIDPVFGFILVAALCYPTIQGVDLDLFGHVVNASYASSFLPAIFGVLLATPIYKFLNKTIPASFKSFLTPLFTLAIVFPITFIVVGPAANWLGQMISVGINAILEFSPIIAGIIVAGFWQVFVLFGVHGVLVMFSFMDMMQGNPSLLLALTGVASFAQIGVVLAIYLKTKDKKLKSIALPAFVSGIFGVTEPAIYGVTLPRMKMFVISCIGAACGGLVVALSGLKMYTYAGMGIIGLLGLLNPENPQIIAILLMVVVAFAVGFVLAFLTYKDDDKVNVDPIGKKKDKGLKGTQEVIKAPVSGKVKPLKESSDDAFASETLGKGVVIIPTDGKVVAPCNGVVRTLFPTKHAIGVVTDGGCEVLIHIGMNTVGLEGKGFTAHVTQGDNVKEGQLLITFDKQSIEQEGYNLETPIIITNSADYLDVVEMFGTDVKHGDSLITVVS